VLRRAGLVMVVLFAAGCRRAAPPALPDARAAETLELTPPGELRDKVNETLEKEHQRTLDPKVE
jgi:hypothetical protein